MKTRGDQRQAKQQQSVAEESRRHDVGNSDAQFSDNRPESIVQRQLQEAANSYTEKNSSQIADNVHKGIAKGKLQPSFSENSKAVKQFSSPYGQGDLDSLDQNQISYNIAGLRFTAPNRFYPTGPATIFLERGTSDAGLQHIYERHIGQFAQAPYNLANMNAISAFLDHRIMAGNYSLRSTSRGWELKMEIDSDHYIRVQMGTNGFIVTAIPESEHTAAISHPYTY